MKFPPINLQYQPNILKKSSSFKLLLKRYWLSLTLTSLLSGFLLTLPTIFYLFNLQIHQFVEQSHEQQQITVFLQPQTSIEKAEALRDKVSTLNNIARAELIDKETALKKIQHIEDINLAINALGGVNPLLHTILITPNKILTKNEIQTLQNTLKKIPTINDVAIDEQWIIFINRITSRLSNFLTTFTVLAALITSTLIFYFMLVRCMSSHAEIKLKFYLGAYPWQIYQPYLGFGLTIGALSGIIAMMLTSISYYLYTSIWQNTIVQKLIYQPTVSAEILFYLLATSIILGVISSYVATFIVRKNILKDYLSIQ